MKKLGKLSINPEKVMKNEELINLKGGYGSSGATLACQGTQVCRFNIPNCDLAEQTCNDLCPGWTGSFACSPW